jgi:hypothetical protein
MRLPTADAFSAAAIINEFDTGGFECIADGQAVADVSAQRGLWIPSAHGRVKREPRN